MELWDIYDETGRPTGRTHPRGALQQPGDYHLVCTVILLNKKGQLLCTHRAPEKELCPNMWESPGGGVLAGEDSLTAALREIREEIGLTLTPTQLTLLYQDKRRDFFMDTYAGWVDIPLSSLRFQPGETDGAQWLSLDDWERQAQAGQILTPAKGDFFKILRGFIQQGPSPTACWSRQDGAPSLKGQIIQLQALAWPEYASEPWPEAQHLFSLCKWVGPQLASHVSVMGTWFPHKGGRYFACGIAEVVTHPACRGKGYALGLLRQALACIRQRQADLCVFTCQPQLVPFYEKAGFQPRPGLCLVGGTPDRPFPSSSLGLTVMLSLLSPKALAHAGDFTSGPITLPLGEDKLW